MHVIRVTTDLTVPDIEEAMAFYGDYLGLDSEDMGLDWVTRFVVPSSGEHIQLVSRDATAPENPLVTVKVDDVDDAYAEARRRGYEVVNPSPRSRGVFAGSSFARPTGRCSTSLSTATPSIAHHRERHRFLDPATTAYGLDDKLDRRQHGAG